MKGEEDDIIVEALEGEEEADSAKTKIAKLKEKIAHLEKEKQDYLDGWQRARADYANLVKSGEENKKGLRKVIEERFIEELIPVVDSFAMAMANKEAWEKVEPTWRTGVEYIYQQLVNVLKERGFTSFGEAGEMFDPALHQAVSDIETDEKKKDHTIATVLQQGYRLGDSILRAARVTVYTLKK